MPTRLSIRSARQTLTSIIRDHNINLVHTYGIRSNLVTGPLAHKLGLPWVTRLPNLNYTDYANPYVGWFLHRLNNHLLGNADAVQVISTPLKEYVASLRRPQARIELIPNGIDLPEPIDETTRKQARRFYQLGEDQVVIGSLGRVEPIKGYDLLLYCLADLPRSCTILIGGEGSECDRLKQQAHVLGFADRFRLLGFVEDVRLFLAACDVYAQPSRSEGVPYALLEGMAMSLPVLATEVGGIGDVVRDGEDGILVPPEDRLMVRDRLMELCADSQMRRDLGRNARMRVEQVGSADAMTRRIEQLYDDLLGIGSKRQERSGSDGS